MMVQVNFKNLRKSSITRELVEERVKALRFKFCGLNEAKILVTLEMENSPHKRGPDLFKIKFRIRGGKYHGLIVEKAHAHFFIALSEVIDLVPDVLNRKGDKSRVKDLKKSRTFINSRVHLDDSIPTEP